MHEATATAAAAAAAASATAVENGANRSYDANVLAQLYECQVPVLLLLLPVTMSMTIWQFSRRGQIVCVFILH